MTKHTAYITSSKFRKNTVQCLFCYNMGDLWHFKREILPRIKLIVSRKQIVIQKTMLFSKNIQKRINGLSAGITSWGNIDTNPLFNTTHSFCKNLFYPFTIVEWKNLDQAFRYFETFSLFRYNILKFIRPLPNSFCNCGNINTRFLTYLIKMIPWKFFDMCKL